MRRLGFTLLLLSCRPDFGERESLVTETRMLAVRGEPPDVKPGESVEYTLLVVDRAGVVTQPASYAFCASPKLLTENDSVASACLRDAVVPTTAVTTIPANACYLFGPETPPGGFRPRDPDVTGGYFQPLRVDVAGVRAFGFERVVCNLANAPALAADDYAKRYPRNTNPTPTLTAPASAAPGERVTLRVAWAPAEAYVQFDPVTQAVIDRRESMRVSWFATAGAFDEDRTGRAEDDQETFTENAWTAPPDAGNAHVWAVLRDSRGGLGWSSATVAVPQR